MTSPLTASTVLVLNGSCRLQCCDINVVVAVGTGNWVQFGMDNMDCKFAICIGLEFRVFIWLLFDPCSRVYSFVSRDISRWNCWTRGVAI